MRINAVFKAPVRSTFIALLFISIMMLFTSCTWIDAFLKRNDTVKNPVLPIKVKTSYDGNGNTGGAVPADNNIYDSGSSVMVLSNSGDLTLTGATFIGWNTKPDGRGTCYETSAKTPWAFTVGNKDVMLYAAWSRDVYIKAGETFNGAINGNAVHIEAGGQWNVTGDSTVFYIDLADIAVNRRMIATASIKSNGFNIYYDENFDQNKPFNLRTLGLPEGGMLMPKFPADVEASINAVHYVDGKEMVYSNENIAIEETCANRSAVYVKNGGLATLKHSSISTSGFNSSPYSSPDENARWGLGSALYASFAGSLKADDMKITVKNDSAGACALFLGHIELSNSSILCDNAKGKSHGVMATYGGRIDLKNVSIETLPQNASILSTDAGGGTINAKQVTGVAHAKGSAGIYANEYGYISVEDSNLKSENDSVVVIRANGITSVKNSTLISSATAVKIQPFEENCRLPGSGTFTNTKIISGSDAFYYNGMSADIVIEDGTTIEVPQGCKLIKADSVKGAALGSNEKLDLTNGAFTAKNVTLNGDIELAEDGTRLMLSLKDGTRYKGAVNGASVTIDSTSLWTVTETCIIASIDAESASRIKCPRGLRVYYDASINNVGKILLNGGGELVPIQNA